VVFVLLSFGGPHPLPSGGPHPLPSGGPHPLPSGGSSIADMMLAVDSSIIAVDDANDNSQADHQPTKTPHHRERAEEETGGDRDEDKETDREETRRRV